MSNFMSILIASIVFSTSAYAQPTIEQSKFTPTFTALETSNTQVDEYNNIYIILEKDNKEIFKKSVQLKNNSAFFRENIQKVLDENKDSLGIPRTVNEIRVLEHLNKISQNNDLLEFQVITIIKELNLSLGDQYNLYSQLFPIETLSINYQNKNYGKITLKRVGEQEDRIRLNYRIQQKSVDGNSNYIMNNFQMNYNFTSNSGKCLKTNLSNPNNDKNISKEKVVVWTVFCSKAKIN